MIAFGDIDPNSFAASLNLVETDFKECAEGLIRKAWAVVGANADLIAWAMCKATGNPDAGDCLIQQTVGTGKRVTIKGASSRKQFFAGSNSFSQTIKIFRNTDAWKDLVDAWCDGVGNGDRQCAAIDLAASLMHELQHLCNRAAGDKAGNCATTYMAENLFRDALFTRYPKSVESTCCNGNAGNLYHARTVNVLGCECGEVNSNSVGASGDCINN